MKRNRLFALLLTGILSLPLADGLLHGVQLPLLHLGDEELGGLHIHKGDPGGIAFQVGFSELFLPSSVKAMDVIPNIPLKF